MAKQQQQKAGTTASSAGQRAQRAQADDAARGTENRPVHTIRYRSVKAAIWQNAGQDGRSFHSVTVSRSWRDEKGEWHDSQSFDFNDLTVLAKAVSDAHTWIAWQQGAAHGEGRKP